MTATIALPTYTFARGLNSAFVRQDSRSSIGTEFAGPSPFEIPEIVVLELDEANRISFIFEYSDSEPPETFDRVAGDKGSVVVQLALKTKKVLRLQFSGDLEAHLKSRFFFDEKMMLSVGGTPFSHRELVGMHRNLMIIRQILSSVPDDVISQLRALDRENVKG